MEPSASVQRFHDRAADYARSRPGYPAALVDHLIDRFALRPGAAVADVGSGTGIFTERLLERGLRVAAVEPGDDMRRMAEARLGGQAGFASVNGTARATTLPDQSVEAIFCAQAFHWFNEEATLREWRRIARPGGGAALIWNYHDEADAFVSAYLDVVHAFGPEARRTMAASWNAHLDNVLFRDGGEERAEFRWVQRLDFDGVLRRAASTSYLPKRDDTRFAAVAERLRAVFERHQAGGNVGFAYRAIAVFGAIR